MRTFVQLMRGMVIGNNVVNIMIMLAGHWNFANATLALILIAIWAIAESTYIWGWR